MDEIEAAKQEVLRLQAAWEKFADTIGFPKDRPRYAHHVIAYAKHILARLEQVEMAAGTFWFVCYECGKTSSGELPTEFHSGCTWVCEHCSMPSIIEPVPVSRIDLRGD